MKPPFNLRDEMPEYRATPFFRAVSPTAASFFLLLAVLAFAAHRLEGFQAGLLAAIPLAAAGAYWLFALAAAPSRVQFDADQLTIQRWLGNLTLRYTDILAVSQSYPLITIETTNGRVRLHKLNANDDALLIKALETYVPSAREARARRLQAGFPIVLQGRLASPLFSAASGVILFGVAAMLIWSALTGNSSEIPDWAFILLFSLACASLGAFLLVRVLRSFAYRTEFTAAQMTQFCLLRTIAQPMNGVTRIETGYQIRTFRNIPRRVYKLTFYYQNRHPFTWVPDEVDADFSNVDAAAQNRVNDLAEMLRFAYQVQG